MNKSSKESTAINTYDNRCLGIYPSLTLSRPHLFSVLDRRIHHLRLLQRLLVHAPYTSHLASSPTHIQAHNLVDQHLLHAKLVDRLVVTLHLTPLSLSHRRRRLLQRGLELHVRLLLLVQRTHHRPTDLTVTRPSRPYATQEGIKPRDQHLLLVERLLQVHHLRVEEQTVVVQVQHQRRATVPTSQPRGERSHHLHAVRHAEHERQQLEEVDQRVAVAVREVAQHALAEVLLRDDTSSTHVQSRSC